MSNTDVVLRATRDTGDLTCSPYWGGHYPTTPERYRDTLTVQCVFCGKIGTQVWEHAQAVENGQPVTTLWLDHIDWTSPE